MENESLIGFYRLPVDIISQNQNSEANDVVMLLVVN